MTTVANTAVKDLGVFIYETMVILGLGIYIARKINYTNETSKVLAKFDIIWKTRKQKTIGELVMDIMVTLCSIAEYMVGMGIVLLFVLGYYKVFSNNIAAKITWHLMTIVFIALPTMGNKVFKIYKCTKANVYGAYETWHGTHGDTYKTNGEHSCPYVEFKCECTDGTNQTITLHTLYKEGQKQLYNSSSYEYSLATNICCYNERDWYVTKRINMERIKKLDISLKECNWLEALAVIILMIVGFISFIILSIIAIVVCLIGLYLMVMVGYSIVRMGGSK